MKWIFYPDGSSLPLIEADAPYPTRIAGEWRFGYRPPAITCPLRPSTCLDPRCTIHGDECRDPRCTIHGDEGVEP